MTKLTPRRVTATLGSGKRSTELRILVLVARPSHDLPLSYSPYSYGVLRCQDEILVARRQFARRFGVLLEIFVLWHQAKDVRLGLLEL